MIRPPPRSTRTDTLFPYTTLFRSAILCEEAGFPVLQPRPQNPVNLQIRVAADGRREVGIALRGEGEVTHILSGVTRLLERTRSEEHTSELQSLMRISYAVFCLKKKNHT